MRFALMIEPSQGITWKQQLEIAERTEAAGFETLYRSDHYESLPGPAGRPTTDAWAAIAGALNVTGALRHGTLVSPVTFRHPSNIAKVVATVNEMSPGRVELGLGAGWHEVEHQRHGLAFPDLETRLQMLEEQLQVVAGLWSGKVGWSFEGRHYQVSDSRYAPSPRPRPPLIVGTQGRPRAIRMAARHADHLNLYYCTPDATRTAFELLDRECRAAGRDTAAVTRSVLLGTIVGEDAQEASRRRDAVIAAFEYVGSPEAWQGDNEHMWITGGPDEAAATVRAYGEAGADQIVFQDFLPDDLRMIDLLGALARKWAATDEPAA
jgi:F420-dependent oxidoreductase-like protein